jgi:hypothetical protein
MSLVFVTENTNEHIQNIAELSEVQLKKIFQYIIVQIDKRFIEELMYYVILKYTYQYKQ